MARAAAANQPAKRSYHHLPATSETVHWGYFSKKLKPQIEIDPGDFITIEALTHHAGDDWDRMIKGDAGAESVYLWTKDKKGVNRRGAGPENASLFGRGAGEGSACTSAPGQSSCAARRKATSSSCASSTWRRAPLRIPPIPARRSAATPRPGGAFTTRT
jgi:hypothetical protein